MVYRPTARVLTVLELLQSHGRMSGPELARRLEVNVRTVRDYIEMLGDLGIPFVIHHPPELRTVFRQYALKMMSYAERNEPEAHGR